LAKGRFSSGDARGGGRFSPAERATAMGIINAGTAVGAMFAPPLVAVILSYLNWRWIFVFTGAFGLIWTAWWALSYVSPIERVASLHHGAQAP